MLRRARALPALERQAAFLREIEGRLPFATPVIETIAADGSYTIERRIPGESLLIRLRRLGGAERQAALSSYAESAEAISTVVLPDRPYGQVLDDQPLTAVSWRDYLRLSLDRFAARNGAAIAAAGFDLANLKAQAIALLDGVAAAPPRALVHGDYFPGNVLIDERLTVSGLVDFSAWTVVGDPLLDILGAAIFLEMTAEATDSDVALVRSAILARHGEAVLAPGRFYRAYAAFAMAAPGTAHGPYPKLFDWALINLAALADGRLAF